MPRRALSPEPNRREELEILQHYAQTAITISLSQTVYTAAIVIERRVVILRDLGTRARFPDLMPGTRWAYNQALIHLLRLHRGIEMRKARAEAAPLEIALHMQRGEMAILDAQGINANPRYRSIVKERVMVLLTGVSACYRYVELLDEEIRELSSRQ